MAAERGRLDVQLAYDRRLRDLNELRRQVSAAFVKTTQLIAPVIEMNRLRWKAEARTATENELPASREREVRDTPTTYGLTTWRSRSSLDSMRTW